MIVVGEILPLQGSFQDALGVDDSVRYRCNRRRLYLTEEHLIRWKFCLAGKSRGGTWVFFGWVCAARDPKLAPRYKKISPKIDIPF